MLLGERSYPELLARARIKMWQATKDDIHLTRPHYKLVYINDWDKDWEEDFTIPELANAIAVKEGLLK